MKPAKFDYERPSSLNAALALLKERPDAKVLAGGQSLGPMLNLRVAEFELLVDISRLSELRRADISGDNIVVGAGMCHSDFEDGRIPSPIDGLFPRIAIGIAYRAVRNRGTVGGSLAHADPAADWPTVMIALGAKIQIRSSRGSRTLDAAELVTGALETCLESDEIIETVTIPLCGKGARVGRYKINAKPGDFAEATAMIVHDPAIDTTRAITSGARQVPVALEKTCAALTEMSKGRAENLEHAVDADLIPLELSPYEVRLHKTSILRAATEMLGK